MSNWLQYIVASTGIYAGVTLLDRYVMGRRAMTPIAFLLIGNVVGMLVAAGTLVAYPEPAPLSGTVVFLGVFVGVLFGIFNYLYFETLQEASPVATVAYMQIVPVIAATGAIFVFGEHLSEVGLLAILFLSVGLTFVSLLDREHATLAAIRMVPGTTLLGIGYVIQKLLLAKYAVPTLLALNRAGALAVALCLFFWAFRSGSRKTFWGEQVNWGVAAAIFGELASVLALYFSLVSYKNGPLAEVSAISALLPVAVLIGAYVLRVVYRVPFWELPESKSVSRIVLTLVASALIAMSVYLISSKGMTNGIP